MKVLIPTAKGMSTKSNSTLMKELSSKSKSILKELLKLSNKDLEKLYKIKDHQAEKEKARWEKIADKTAQGYAALNLFDGLMYRNIKRESLSKEEQEYFAQNVFITSSFYGIINVFEYISEHRLDFLQNIKVEGKSLKQTWKSDYDSFVENEELVISLLSSEFEEVFSKKAREKFVKIIFLEEKEGVRKTHSTISKKARGKFLSYLVEKQITDIEELKKIEFENYKLEKELSTEKELVFVAQLG
ncbi:MAG: peroxide stress protein YaaA [Gemella sp.]|nr:peroxide stress protein YaaA [Gemella sp.]